MKVFLCLLSLLMMTFSTAYSGNFNCNCKTHINSSKSDQDDQKNSKSRLTYLLSTYEGCLLLCGWEEAEQCGYDVSKLTKEEKNAFINKGFLILSTNANLDEHEKLNSTILALYFSEKKDLKKALYWAFRGAKRGSGDCMLILSNAYRSGEGLVLDYVEGVKWTYLGAAVGHKWCKNWVSENTVNSIIDEHLAPIIKEGQERARLWMNEHPEIFISSE